jgi:hypothetical protein
VFRTALDISGPCYTAAAKPGALGLTPATTSAFENTGVFSGAGQFYIDIGTGKVFVSAPAPPKNATLAVTQTLLRVVPGAHDIDFVNLSFVHSGWSAPSVTGIVERYGGVLSPLGANHGLTMSPAAVMVAGARNVSFTRCRFSRLGAWGLRLFNATQRATVSRCEFDDLSGGGISIGDTDDTTETNPDKQMAQIFIADNTITRVGVEYKGSTGVHSFCMRQSSIAHNLVKWVPYTGLSFNWPTPQGPTFPAAPNAPNVGYSRDNTVVGNDVSEYMSYMLDGGGIHTIGQSLNTTIYRNHFHDVASGTMCGAVPCHSTVSQSTIYIDNWSNGFTIDQNVVTDTAYLKMGWIFFQYFAGVHNHGGEAHDNYAHNNTICNAGPVPQARDPWDEVNGTNVTGTTNVTAAAAGRGCIAALPPMAASVVAEAGPRQI